MVDDAKRTREELIRELEFLRRENRNLRGRGTEYYRDFFERAPLGYQSLDRDGRILEANQAWLQLLGYEQSEVLGKWFGEFLTPDSRELFKGRFPRFLEIGEVRNVIFEMVRKDGSLLLAAFDGRVGHDEQGGFRQTHCILHDVGEDWRGRDALLESEHNYRTLFENSVVGLYQSTPDGRFVNVNPALATLLGYDSPEELMQSIAYIGQELYPEPADRDRLLRVLREKGEILGHETRFRRKDGSEVWVSENARAVRDESTGELSLLEGSLVDVTARVLANRELLHSQKRLHAILDGIDADVYVSDLETHEVLFINKHMVETFGECLPGVPCWSHFRNDSGQCSHCRKPWLLSTGGKDASTEVYEGFNPISKRWYLNHDRVIEWLEGRLVHMHLAADITRLKRMEEQLTRAKAQAEQASLAKNEFLANMSHEIRTPLNGLLGILQLLRFSDLTPEQRNYLGLAMKSGRGLLHVLNDILDLSKVESGKVELEETDFEIGSLMDSVVSVFRHPAEKRGVQCSWDMDPGLPNCFRGDKGRLRQILFNLVGNAVKFTQSGHVRVEGYPLGQTSDGRTRLYFEVNDSGIGIPEDKLKAVFDPFFQVDGSYTRKYQGTGLGLGIARRLVGLMDGNMSISSEEGKGTTIAFCVAVKSAGQAECESCAYPLASMPRITELRILVAEDERINRVVVERLLNQLGHVCVCVETGEDALDQLGRKQFDCVLMDIQMPGMDGLETTRAIRSDLDLEIPVIALTAHAMQQDRARFLEAGMNGYVPKPFEVGDLEAEIQRVMRRD